MPHIADHQFVPLLELASRNGASQKIADRSQEGNVPRPEVPSFGGANTENAVGPPVAGGDGHVQPTLAIVILQISRHIESFLLGEIADHDRSPRVQGEARQAIRRSSVKIDPTRSDFQPKPARSNSPA